MKASRNIWASLKVSSWCNIQGTSIQHFMVTISRCVRTQDSACVCLSESALYPLSDLA